MAGEGDEDGKLPPVDLEPLSEGAVGKRKSFDNYTHGIPGWETHALLHSGLEKQGSHEIDMYIFFKILCMTKRISGSTFISDTLVHCRLP